MPQSSADFDKTAEAKYLHATVDRLAARDFSYLESQIDDRVRQVNVREGLEQAASALPAGVPITTDPVNWNFFVNIDAVTGTNSRIANVAAQYAYPSARWVVVSAQLSGEPNNFRLVGLNVQALSAPLAEINAFTLKNKGFLFYLFCVFAIFAPICCVYAFVCCLRTPGVKRKWLWMIFTLIGVAAFTLNWSDGSVSVDALHFNLLSASVARVGWLGPWNVTFCVPVGAVLFLWKYRKARLVSPATA